MRFGKYIAAAAAATLAVAPAMAAPVNPAASLSLGHASRAGSHGKHKDSLLGGVAVAVAAAVAVVVAVVVVADDSSSSP